MSCELRTPATAMPLRSRARSMHQRIARTAPTTWLRSPSRSSASSVSRSTRMWGRGFMPPRYASARKPSRWTPWLSWPRSSESSKTSAICSASSRGSSSRSNAAIKQCRRSSIRTRRISSPQFSAMVTRFQLESEDDEVLLVAVEFSDAWEERPSFEAEAFEQPEAEFVAGEGPCGKGLYAQIRSTPDSFFQHAPAYTLSPVALLDVDADLGGPVVGRPAVPEVTEAEPAYHLSVLFGHPDRTSRRVVLVKPRQPLFDGDGLCVGRHYLTRNDGIVDLHDGREILQRGITHSHARRSIPAQRCIASLQSSRPGTSAILTYPSPPASKALPGATITPSSISRSA